MKKVLIMCVAFLMLFSLVGCSGLSTPVEKNPSETSQQNVESSETTESIDHEQPNVTNEPEDEEDEFIPLEVKESGYYMVDEYLFCAVILNNPNDNYAIEFPTFRVTAYDADDKILGTDDQTLSIIYPNQDFAYAGQFFDVSEQPARVEVTALKPEDYNIISTDFLDHPTYEQMIGSNISFNDNDVLGEISNTNDYDFDMAIVTVIFRDESGNIVSGNSSFVDQVAADSKTPFEISIYSDVEITENYDITANPW